ncbi:MAG: GDP-L-fucose synthase [Desulfovibrionaceae bacterium]|nr:GDP-L-fucose synthase [Desulfovibrionaceae bacterium]MBF0514036.1 GDP-L-fucose synthase [Desulfovibrionaceae bacterium]
MLTKGAIFVAGHRGLAGSAFIRRARREWPDQIITRSHAELDLTDQAATRDFFASVRPDYVYLAAAKVGGIHANNAYPADFIRDNLLIQTNVIDGAWRAGVKKLVFLGSSCIYPKFCPQPMKEEHLLTGALEPTNQWYAVAKIAGVKMCQAYRRQYGFRAICLQPTNIYGPGDNFVENDSHVMPALIRRFHEAKISGAPEVAIWGTGSAKREFLHVDDLADASWFCLHNYDEEEIVNIGTGRELTIKELAGLVKQTVGYAGAVAFDAGKPDGTPRKLLDVSRLSERGWTAQTGLAEGLADTYRWFLENEEKIRK